MSGHVAQAGTLTGFEHGIVRGEKCWQELMARMQNSVAIADRLPERSKARDFQENDLVSVQRHLLVGIHHIFKGSAGVVTAIRNGGRLFDVKFFCDPSIAITIRKFDLLPAS